MFGEYNEWTVHVMGFGRIVGMKGGITSLPENSLIRKLIIWYEGSTKDRSIMQRPGFADEIF